MSRFILGMSTFREPCSPLHQDEEQPNTELFLPVIPFLYYTIYWSGGGKEKNYGWGEAREVEEIGQSSITGKIFYLCCSHYLYLDYQGVFIFL